MNHSTNLLSKKAINYGAVIFVFFFYAMVTAAAVGALNNQGEWIIPPGVAN